MNARHHQNDLPLFSMRQETAAGRRTKMSAVLMFSMRQEPAAPAITPILAHQSQGLPDCPQIHLTPRRSHDLPCQLLYDFEFFTFL